MGHTARWRLPSQCPQRTLASTSSLLVWAPCMMTSRARRRRAPPSWSLSAVPSTRRSCATSALRTSASSPSTSSSSALASTSAAEIEEQRKQRKELETKIIKQIDQACVNLREDFAREKERRDESQKGREKKVADEILRITE